MIAKSGKAAIALVFCFALLQAGACSRTQQYLAGGAALGAAGGAFIGAAAGGSMLGGAVVGTALGTGGGYIASRR